MTRTGTLLAAIIFCAGTLGAQEYREMSQAEYKKLMEQAMKSGTYSQNQTQSWDVRLRAVSGSVMVKPSGKDEWVKITGNIPLEPDDAVKTGATGIAELYFDNKGVISVSRNTELELSSLEQEDAVVSLAAGSLVAKVKHFLNEKHHFRVKTNTAFCDIRGTEFAVEYSALSKEASFGVFEEGKVEVSLPGDDGKPAQSFMLEKKTEIVINPDRKRFKAVPLFGMGRHRAALSKVRTRLTALKNWKPVSQERRDQLRERALKGNTVRRQIKGKSRNKTRTPRKTR